MTKTLQTASVLSILWALAVGHVHGQEADFDEDAARQQVMTLLKETSLIDGHNDAPWQFRKRAARQIDQIDFHDTTTLEEPMHTDIPRLRAGGVGGVFWSVYVPIDRSGGGGPQDVLATLEQIDVVHRLIAAYSDDLELALTADDVERIHAQGKIASLIGMEGGHSIGNSLAALRQFYRAGARYMTITHTKNAAWADSSTDEPIHGGLSPFGKEVIREMNRLGMLVDLSHVSADVMRQTLDLSQAPVIFSHSSAMAVTDHVRNVPDDVLKRMSDNGGVVMVTFFAAYVSNDTAKWDEQRLAERARLREVHPNDEKLVTTGLEAWREQHPAPWPTVSDVADHIDHVRAVAGIDHVGLGSDYDGMPPGPTGLEDTAGFPNLFVELMRRGYSDEDLRKIAGKNVLRALREAEQVAADLQQQRPASDATIEALDGQADQVDG